MTEQTPNQPDPDDPATRSFPTEPAETAVPGEGGVEPSPSPWAFGSGGFAGPGSAPAQPGQPPYPERPPTMAKQPGTAPPGPGPLPPGPGPAQQQQPYGERPEYPAGPPAFGPPPQGPPPQGPPAGPPPYGQPPGEPRPPRTTRTGALVAAAVVLALGGGAAGAGVMHAIEGNNTKTVTSSLSGPPISSANNKPTGSVAQVASVVRPSVVSIQVEQGEGSGIILSSDGLILTNNHVVESAASGGQIQVTFDDGKTAAADLVGRDPTSDLAVVKAKNVNDLKPASLGKSSDINVGDNVVAIGSPLGLQGTVTSGIVSAKNRPVRTGDENGGGGGASTAVLDAIQTDAAINPGNSGGPLVNMAGQVIGINSAIASTGGGQMSGSQPGNIGVGFAIPIDEARPIAEQLEKTGKATHSQLGVQVKDSQGDTAGANLAGVTGGGPADQAGLKQGDVVTKVDDRRVDSADALIAAVRSHAPGSKVQITYVRGGSEHTATVTLGTASS
ncbi:MAG: S1C family serine protease [Mycobacteriales bacterium]